MVDTTVLCEHLQAPSMCKDCRIARREAEIAELREQVEKLKAPVSDEEWNPHAWFDDGEDDIIGNMTRPQVDTLIAGHAGQKEAKNG